MKNGLFMKNMLESPIIFMVSKKEQELIAKKYSENFNIQTIARPCSF